MELSTIACGVSLSDLYCGTLMYTDDLLGCGG